ncbi:MAG TPA: ATP-binding protein [Parafilimonas sp.]|nr:ATP-binding protein [Parafilimonas sp.]
MLTKIIGFFIPPVPEGNNEYQRRVRLITYALFITALFSLFYVAVSWLSGYTMGVAIMLCGFIIFTALLFLLKFGVNVYAIANIFGFTGIIIISGSVYFSGGAMSPVLPWFATTPIVILLLAGKKSGSFWAVISVLCIVIFSMLKHNGYVFPEVFSPQQITFYLSCYAGLVLIIYFISIVFENLRISAFNAVSSQKDELQQALLELKSAQAQLIQSEKMASLGELTAGIAHEIQNPLNFVNNFSDINNELIEELKSRRATIQNQNQEESSILNDIFKNNEKIVFHGKRADAIVKAMLQHSRKSSGEKEATDINALCDEYLRLSYHGLRAKTKSFNADIKTDFDKTIGAVHVIPQDFGRAILNLFNNAFYAVNEKKKTAGSNYSPMVLVKTKKIPSHQEMGATIQILIKDNGAGIPQDIIDKIFQPFFTTKPTGEGTGLGLSLAYDIITREYNGTIKVESAAFAQPGSGESGSTFIIELPAGDVQL